MAAVIRRARDGDEKRVAEFAIRLFQQHVDYDAERFSTFADVQGAEKFYRSRFDTKDSAVFVAESDEVVVGFAYVELDERNYAQLLENGAWLHDIYIDDSARKEGLGSGLIKAAAEAMRQKGAKKLLLTVAAKNMAAQQAFEKAGFRPTMVEMTLNLPDSLQ
jgi:GNAT superfamily N-acetyltransferase